MQCLEKKKCSGFSVRTLGWELGMNMPEFLEAEHSCTCTHKSGQCCRTLSPRETGMESPAQASPAQMSLFSLTVASVFKEW